MNDWRIKPLATERFVNNESQTFGIVSKLVSNLSRELHFLVDSPLLFQVKLVLLQRLSFRNHGLCGFLSKDDNRDRGYLKIGETFGGDSISILCPKDVKDVKVQQRISNRQYFPSYDSKSLTKRKWILKVSLLWIYNLEHFFNKSQFFWKSSILK